MNGANLRAALAPLGLYNLNPKSLVYAETEAYGAAGELILDDIVKVPERLFAADCPESELERFERLLDLPSGTTTVENRRDIIISKLSVAQGDYNMAGILRSVRAAGLDAKIEEKPADFALRIYDASVIGGFSTISEVRENVYAMLPAHLVAEFDIGKLTWVDFDAKNKTFAQLNSADFTWEWFDLNGEKL